MSNVSKCFFCANKKDYDAKFGYFGCAYSGQECKDYSMFEPKVKPKAITNADRIRAMSDEELAEWLDHHVSCSRCPIYEKCIFYKTCDENLQAWLKEEVKE